MHMWNKYIAQCPLSCVHGPALSCCAYHLKPHKRTRTLIRHCFPLVLVPFVHPRLQLNTFQLVLATDGRRSIAVFNYAEDGINWAGEAVAGYNVGDGEGYFQLPGSFREDIQHIDNTTGNTGKEGQWLLVLDGESHNHITLYIQLHVYCFCCTSLLFCYVCSFCTNLLKTSTVTMPATTMAYAWAQAVVRSNLSWLHTYIHTVTV